MTGVIDAHVHLGLGESNEECEQFLKRSGYVSLKSPSELLTESSSIEIEKLALVPSFPCGNKFSTDAFYNQNKWIRGYEDRFLQFGTINPQSDIDVVGELSNQYSLGIVGIKLHPVHHFFKANDYRPEELDLKNLAKIYQFAEDHELPVLIHTGTSVTSSARNKYADPIYVDDVAKDYNINIVLAHSGRPLWTDTAFFLARQFRNIYLEISSIPPNRLMEYIPRIDEIKDKVIYGSDYPNYPGESILKDAEAMGEIIGFDHGIMKDNFLKVANIR